MNTEKEADKILIDLHPYHAKCIDCGKSYNSLLMNQLFYNNHCVACVLRRMTAKLQRLFIDAIMMNGGIGFMERVYFNQYDIELITDTIGDEKKHYLLKLTPKE